MIRHLTFSSYISKMEGGTTSPWLISGTLPDGSSEDVVLKMFLQKRYGSENPTLNEFLALFLAEEFDLECLEPFIVTFNGYDNGILDKEQEYKLYSCGGEETAYFGCKYLDGALNKPKSTRFSDYHYENIFAFDTLIINPDRRVNKANLLYTNESCYIIDHEQCFSYCVNYKHNKNKRSIWNFINPGVKGPHLFLKELKRLKSQKKTVPFDTFAEGLKCLNLFKLDKKVNNLEKYEIDVSNWSHIRNYLLDVKNDIPGFIRLLNDIIETP